MPIQVLISNAVSFSLNGTQICILYLPPLLFEQLFEVSDEPEQVFKTRMCSFGMVIAVAVASVTVTIAIAVTIPVSVTVTITSKTVVE